MKHIEIHQIELSEEACMALRQMALAERALSAGSKLLAQRGDAWAGKKRGTSSGVCDQIVEDLFIGFIEGRCERALGAGACSLDIQWWHTLIDNWGYVEPHDHGEAILSGVLFTGFGSDLVLHEPELEIYTHPGRLVLFSGQQQHSVRPHHGPPVRHSIAFNVMP